MIVISGTIDRSWNSREAERQARLDAETEGEIDQRTQRQPAQHHLHQA